MSDKIVNRVAEELKTLKSIRAPYESEWQDIAKYFAPRSAGGWRNATTKPIISTPRRMLSVFTSIMHDVLTPKGQIWHTLKPSDGRDDVTTLQYCEQMNDKLFHARYGGGSGFGSAMLECYESLGAFGSMILYTEEGYGDIPILYRCIPLSECYLTKNAFGRVETIYREFTMTALQMVRRFGADNVSPSVLELAQDVQKRHRKITVVHGVFPFDQFDGDMDSTTPVLGGDVAKNDSALGDDLAHVDSPIRPDFAFAGVYIDMTHKTVLQRGGYYEFPYHHADYAPSSIEPYSQGPAGVALPDVKLLENQTRLVMRSAEKSIDPPMATVEKLSRRLRLDAGSVNPGMVNSQGQVLAQPLGITGNIAIGLEMMDKTSHNIGRPFFADLLMLIANKPNMTAQEVMQLTAEKSMMLGPVTEDPERALSGMVKRELGILFRRLMRMGKGHGLDMNALKIIIDDLQVIYTSPMARLRREVSGQGLENMLVLLEKLQSLGIAGTDNINGDAVIRDMAKTYGVASKVLYTESDVDSMRLALARLQQDPSTQNQPHNQTQEDA